MITRDYVITGKTINGSIAFKFDLNGILRTFENSAELTNKQLEWFATHIPTKESFIEPLIKSSDGKLKAEKLDYDLSFASFWEEYGNKKGSKEQARRLYEGDKVTENKRPVTEGDRLAIFKILPRLNYHYQINKKELPYPTTFLNQRRWENEF